MRHLCVLIAVFCAISCTGRQQTDLGRLPDTPAARKFRELVEVRKKADYDALRRFYSQNLVVTDEAAIEGNAATDVDMFRRFGPREILAYEVLESTPLRLVLLAQETGSTPSPTAWVRYEIEVTPDASHRISRQQFISFGHQKPDPGKIEIPPPPGFQLSDRKPADPEFPPGEAPWEKPFPVADSVLQSYVGTYDFDPPNNSSMLVTTRNGQLYAQFSGQQEVRIFPKTETRFYADGRVMRWIEFTRDANGKISGLSANSSGFESTDIVDDRRELAADYADYRGNQGRTPNFRQLIFCRTIPCTIARIPRRVHWLRNHRTSLRSRT
jgi:Domain of unknown function (DUF3471)